MLGEMLGHYRVLEKIGEGGMGIVYRAHDEQLGRDVALKVLPAGMLTDDAARKRFRKEALALAKLNHPNIETVFEFSSQEGVDFLAMELIPGYPLSERIKEGPLPQGQIVRLAIQIAEGLSAAHNNGVIHRDLKPGNLMITPEGQLKILDFGLAKFLRLETAGDVTRSFTTETGTVSGTVPYMSPEQLCGLPVDVRSDIYTAGAVLYEMATGQRPFPQTQAAELMAAILRETPMPPSSKNRLVTPALDLVVMKALEKEPARRFQSARELLAALEGAATGVVPQAPRFGWPLAATASALLLAILVAGWTFGLNLAGLRDRILRHNALGATGSGPTALIRARRSVAVLGFKNVSGRAEEAWLSTALSEMLVTELAAGEQLRTVPGENVAQMKINLSLPDEDSYGRETLLKIHKNLNADDVVLGSYVPLGNSQVRLDLRLQDAVQGETLASVSEKGSETEIDALVSRAGAALREKLGVGAVSEAEAAAVKATLPSNPEAARFYSDGLAKLRIFDALAARDLLEKSVATDPQYPLAHSALASAWSTLGYDAKAEQQAKKAFELSDILPREQRLWVEGLYRETTHEWAKAIEVYKSLQDFFPDNVEYGLRLVAVQTTAGQGKDTVATIAKLRRIPPPARDDPRIDLAEANAAMALGNFRRAQETAGLAATRGEAQGARLLVAHARLTEGAALQNLGKMKEAVQAAEEAKKFFTAAGDRSGVASAEINIGNLLYRTGDTPGATGAWKQSLSISREIGHESNIEMGLNNMGTAIWHTGDLAAAKRELEQALAIARKIDDVRGAARTMNNLAGLLHQKGDLPAAQHMEEGTLEEYRQMGDKSNTASALSNLGLLLREQGDLSGSRARYEESLALYREIGETSGVASVTNSLGNLLTMRSNFPEAKAIYEQSLAAYTEIGDKTGMLEVKNNLGNLLYDGGDLPGARKLYDQALALARETQEKSAVAEVLVSIGKLRETQGDLAGARGAYEESLAVRKEIGEKGGIADSLVSLASLSNEEGHPAGAESPAREAAQEFHQEKSAIDEEAALAVLARSLLLQGKIHAAAAAIDQAQKLAAKSEERASRTTIAILGARTDAASGNTEAAEKSLESILSEAVKLDDFPTQLEARFALGEVEMKSGKVDSSRARLAALEKDATAKGFLLIARKVAAARN